MVEALKEVNILITGANGMLGTALCDSLKQETSYSVVGLDDKVIKKFNPRGSFFRCDITDYSRLVKVVKKISPHVIINAAAYTDVDGCELDPGKAEAINALGARYVAEVARKFNSLLIHISTDFVFDGKSRDAYTEKDVPNPINAYGRTKLDGERFIAEVMGEAQDYIIIRTSWLFGLNGKNFVDTILKKVRREKKLRIVSDQFGSPTYTADLADAIKKVLAIRHNDKGVHGIYHITNSDNCSWYKLAKSTLELASVYDIDLIPITSEELDRPAERPPFSILDNNRFAKLTGRRLRFWNRALGDYIRLRGR